MTVKKAIKILDWLINQEINRTEGFVDPKHSWNQGFDYMRDLATSLAKSHEDNMTVLNVIKKELSKL